MLQGKILKSSNNNAIKTFQTILYKGIRPDGDGPWYYNEVLFKSSTSEEPRGAMRELNLFKHTHPDWFASMRIMENGEILEEDTFDSSVVVIE